MADIESRDDVERLVRAFYEKAMTDPMIGFLFTDVAKLDLDEHLPVITSFWETMLLGAKSYGGGAFAPHASLHRKAGLRAPHFERWLWLWRGTVDELFAGPVAEEAKAHANRVAAAFYRRLADLDAGAEPDPQQSDPLAVIQYGGGRAQS
jgi:hemoglobin